ncbi:hypothetical protein DITRI_Ditri17bG0125600 [Diplodiscus trichospermus]
MPIPTTAILIVPVIWGGLGLLVGYFVPPKDKVLLEDACNYSNGTWVTDFIHWEAPYYNNPYEQRLFETPIPELPDLPYPGTMFPNRKNTTCPFIPEELDCIKKRRPDVFNLEYRFKPSNCSPPRFYGEKILTLYKGKRFIFVGDSVGYDQYISFICLLYSDVRGTKYLFETKGDLTNLTFSDYNISVIFSRNDFLVDTDVGDQNERILKLDSIGNGAVVWKDADVLVFNSWNVWLYIGQNQSWDVIEEGNTRHKDMDPWVAYEKSLNTLAKWVNSTLDTTKTKVFIVGVSADHFNASDWTDSKAENCKSQTRPAAADKYPGAPQPSEAVLPETLKSLPESVHFVNVGPVPEIRKDAHPSIDGSKDDFDCRHWCLPGVPDAWNEVLYPFLRGY